jgi:hypothetical protein
VNIRYPVPAVTEYDSDEPTEGRKWKASLPFELDFSQEYFEDLAAAYEAGEISGFCLHINGEHLDTLPPDLLRRLGPLVQRVP